MSGEIATISAVRGARFGERACISRNTVAHVGSEASRAAPRSLLLERRWCEPPACLDRRSGHNAAGPSHTLRGRISLGLRCLRGKRQVADAYLAFTFSKFSGKSLGFLGNGRICKKSLAVEPGKIAENPGQRNRHVDSVLPFYIDHVASDACASTPAILVYPTGRSDDPTTIWCSFAIYIGATQAALRMGFSAVSDYCHEPCDVHLRGLRLFSAIMDDIEAATGTTISAAWTCFTLSFPVPDDIYRHR
ncbi:hypothetical protein OBBRIDRAFT_803288 [Obba rivulosa]|uniref:Uncharacterized protein n=1 Tax=Obba rivulosa TaxID=1052685 RepID=A0A8E2B395_9APHY|nr:hypothetical protein OBBRIDRAFT_803288 [Obba rivulosa]